MRVSVLLFIAVLQSVTSCPFLNSSPGQRRQQSNSTYIRDNAKSKGRKSLCSKTNFVPPKVAKESICSAYFEVDSLFSDLVDSNVASTAAIFGSVMRLVFHDAGEINIADEHDRLGPDGCLANDGSSDGLTEDNSITVKFLEPIWQAVCDRISRADFWVLLGNLVLERAIFPAIPMFFHNGRKDNVECEGGAGRLPQDNEGHNEIVRVFVDQMGLTLNDAVTLIGAHSLGQKHIDVSGHGIRDENGKFPAELLNAWDTTPSELDNGFFVKLVTLSWKAFLTEDKSKQQWRHRQDPYIFLNTDMSLVYPIATEHLPDADGSGAQSCQPKKKTGPPHCKRPASDAVPSTFELCRLYAQDNNAFQRAFVDAYQRMVTVGYGLPENREGATAKGKLGTLTAIDLSTC